MIPLVINGTRQNVDVPGDTPLLWTLRDELGLTGTKFGCGMALCGACTVHLDGQAVCACITPISSAANRNVVTIEGLGTFTARVLLYEGLYAGTWKHGQFGGHMWGRIESGGSIPGPMPTPAEPAAPPTTP